jgi:hypothetical protein
MTRANDTELLAEAEDLENDNGTSAMILDILDPFLSRNSNFSSSMHLISSPGSRSSAYSRRPKEAGTRFPPKMSFWRPAPAARGSLPVSKRTKPLSGKHKLEAGRFPPSSKMNITNHLVSSSETISPIVGDQLLLQHLFFAFSALKSEAEAEPACRNRPTTSRSSPFSSISAFNLPKSIIIWLRHAFTSQILKLPY